jgi:hypothetical protein
MLIKMYFGLVVSYVYLGSLMNKPPPSGTIILRVRLQKHNRVTIGKHSTII